MLLMVVAVLVKILVTLLGRDRLLGVNWRLVRKEWVDDGRRLS